MPATKLVRIRVCKPGQVRRRRRGVLATVSAVLVVSLRAGAQGTPVDDSGCRVLVDKDPPVTGVTLTGVIAGDPAPPDRAEGVWVRLGPSVTQVDLAGWSRDGVRRLVGCRYRIPKGSGGVRELWLPFQSTFIQLEPQRRLHDIALLAVDSSTGTPGSVLPVSWRQLGTSDAQVELTLYCNRDSRPLVRTSGGDTDIGWRCSSLRRTTSEQAATRDFNYACVTEGKAIRRGNLELKDSVSSERPFAFRIDWP